MIAWVPPHTHAWALTIERGDPAAVSATARSLAPGGPLRAEVHVRTEKPRLGDAVELAVHIVAQPDIVLLAGEYGRTLGDWEVVEVRPGKPQHKNGSLVREDILTVKTFTAGEVEVPPVVQKFKTAEGQPAEFHSAPLRITVEPLPSKPNDRPGEIRGLKAPRGMVSWWMLGTALVLVLLLGSAAGAYYRRLRRLQPEARPAGPPRPPEEIARERLQQLRAADWLARGQFKLYYSELSDILRRYLEAVAAIPAIDRTTPELMRELKKTSVARQDINAVRNVLEQSDLVKFAKWKPVEKDALGDWTAVAEIVEHTAAAIKTAPESEAPAPT